ncbi:MAG: type III polyketide synthase [Waddliaceae bacterium]
MKPCILSFGKGIPRYSLPQKEIARRLSDLIGLGDQEAYNLEKLFLNSTIQQRFSVIPDIIGRGLPNEGNVGMSERNAIYKREAPKLAERAAKEAIENWGGQPDQLSHIISISCTGVIAPGIEFLLIEPLGLRRTIKRLGINFMGCFGAFQGLRTAAQIAQQHPEHRVLVICTELCSLHLHSRETMESIVINSLFSDGAAAFIMGCDPTVSEQTYGELVNDYSYAFEGSLDAMTWEAGDEGYEMSLSASVPSVLQEGMHSFLQELLPKDVACLDCNWAIHPGGKAILEKIEKVMGLSQEKHTAASRHILANHGNMSSATFLYLLDHLQQKENKKEWTIGMGFGPGLSIEGVLLKQ